MKKKEPSTEEIKAELGPAQKFWTAIVDGLAEQFGTVAPEWKPSKTDFGSMCLLKHKKKTLLYLTPDHGAIRVAIVLGERAVAIALESNLPKGIKTLIQEARPYAEGRGIRFMVNTPAQVRVVRDLVAIKATPKSST